MTASFAGLDAALRLREWMLKEMFDVFAIWNSNGWFPAGKGGVPAIAKALRTYAPVYGTPMYTLGGCNIATGAASPQGYAVAGLNFGQQYQNVGAGRWFDSNVYRDDVASTHPDFYARYAIGRGVDSSSPFCGTHRPYITKANMTVANDPSGMSINASAFANDLQPTHPLVGYWWFTDTTTSGGSFKPGFNSYNGTSWTKRSEAALQEVVDGEVGSGMTGMVVAAVTQAAIAGATIMEQSWHPRGGTLPLGEIGLGYARSVHGTREKGFAYHDFWSQGGKSPRDFANALSLMPDAAIRHKLIEVGGHHQRQLGKRTRCVMSFNDIFNHINEPEYSINNSFEGGSVDALLDDCRYIMQRFFTIWDQTWLTDEGGTGGFLDPRNLIFVYCNDFPQQDPETTENIALREALATLAEEFAPRVVSFNTHEFFTSDDIVAAGGYDSNGHAHLTQGAYEEWGRRMVNRIVMARPASRFTRR